MLLMATQALSHRVLRLLISCSSRYNFFDAYNGMGILHVAATNEYQETMRYLMDAIVRKDWVKDENTRDECRELFIRLWLV